MEEFIDIPGYEGLYQVSNLGNVKSLLSKGKNLSTKPNVSNGYVNVVLIKNKVRTTFRVHRLVASVFLNNNDDILVVDHINSVKHDNKLSNLQMLTHRENTSKDKKGTSKYTGVSWDKKSCKWVAMIYINKKHYNLGYYDCELKAASTYNHKLNQLDA